MMISITIQVISVLIVIILSCIPGLSQNSYISSENRSICDSVPLSMNDLQAELDTLVISDLPVSYDECERMLNSPKLPTTFVLNYESENVDSLSVYEYLVHLDEKLGHSEVIVKIIGREDVFELGDINARSKYRNTVLKTSEFLYQYRSGKYNIKVLIN